MKKETINTALVGDIAPVGYAEKYILKNPLLFNEHLNQIFDQTDLIFANLEAPVTMSENVGENKKYIFKISPDVLKQLPKNMVFSIANNHILDYGEQGLKDTIESLKSNNIKFTGAGINIQEAGEPIIVHVSGNKIGFIAAADTRFQVATSSKPGTFPANASLLSEKIKKLREKVQFIYISIHMGMEFIPVPTPSMINIEETCRNAGADVIAFHHAHCVSGYSLGNKQLTLWGVGNFIFPAEKNYPFKPWFDAVIYRVKHAVETKKLNVTEATYTIDNIGIPRETNAKNKKRISNNIRKISKAVERKRNLNFMIIKYIFRSSYLKLFIVNYIDIAKRQGVKTMLKTIFSSFRVLFSKN